MLAVALPAPPASAVAVGDSTSLERWTLPNGLDVVAHDVPGARVVCVSLGIRSGSDADPADQPGLAELLAEVQFMAPAGDIPARTRDDMESVRPSGWAVRVNPATTVIMESATRAQFAGVLHQVATRLAGVTVTPEALQAARAAVHKDIGERVLGDPAGLLYVHLRELARGMNSAALVAYAAARGLDKLTPARVQAELAARYAPANAVLAITGDLSAWNVRDLVQQEFGGIPAGTPLPVTPPARLDSAAVVMRRAGVSGPTGAVGVLAPALGDTLYPSFFIAMVMLATHTHQIWGPPAPPLTARFQYSVLDDPSMARFYPRLPAGQSTVQDLVTEFGYSTDDVMRMTITSDAIREVAGGTEWLFGGPMPAALRQHVRDDPAALNQLGVNDALRALLGTESFWALFRVRLDPLRARGPSTWMTYLAGRAHLVRLMLLPK
jgi:peptidase M16-like protein